MTAPRSILANRSSRRAQLPSSGGNASKTGDRPLTRQAYRFRLSGLDEAEGHVKVETLMRALKALVKTAESATRLAATGRSGGRGARPRWLREALDFTITGLEPGSTILEIEAPRLGDVPDLDLTQRDLWLQQPSSEDTSLDLGARAAAEVQRAGASGDYFDANVVQAILGFGNAATTADVRYELIAKEGPGTGFVLEASACPKIRERLHLIPAPRAFVVSGRLDEIGHGLGRFRLLIDGGSLPGRLDRKHLDVELLRPLWGKLATVQGIVHFKSSGQPRLIEARRIDARSEGDKIFETVPQAEPGGGESAGVLTEPDRRPSASRSSLRDSRRVDPMVLWGAWPGDEPIEKLLAELD